ncbi:MAG: hypothetical protein RTU30_12580, partial [Candidatus Thorarchaeota archaeon]
MKRVLVLAIIVLAILALPPTTNTPPNPISSEEIRNQGPNDPISVSSASGTGDARGAIEFASRQVNSLSLSIANSYASTNVHSGELDLSSYLIPGWSLYKAEIQADSMTAIAERETTGITPNTYIMTINNTGQITDALYQEFYNQPHDGKLENYTITYLCTYYSASLGHAYLGVRSNYSDPQTNVTSWLTPFTQILSDTEVTHDVSGESAILDGSTNYFVVIDGTAMQGGYIGGWKFNEILWSATSATLGLETGYNLRGDDWYIYEGIGRREAELDYTYTPWNQTSNSALVYSSPNQVALKGNSSSLQGTSWAFTDPSNITQIDFSSNQSINLDYNMTLWYQRSASTTTAWSIPSSGADVEWSVETAIEYPKETQANYLNISIPASWNPDGLYNSTHPVNNHTTYTSNGITITCSQLYNETWTLELTSENLMKTLKTYTTVDDTEVVSKTMMFSNMDINSTIQEPDTDPVTSGTVNLEIWYSGAPFWTPSDKSITNGLAHYLWDLRNPMTQNGEYTIETYWSNGTEAGYLSKSIVLYYPTSMDAESYDINAFTESNFDIRVTLNDTFTPQGLNGTLASLVYSFDGAANQSMTDLNNGTWAATISTTGKVFGQYDVMVYATGYAIQNQSLQIDVDLIHDTESLTILWSNSNDITYIETTELSVAYNRVGSTPITGATVNVTIDTTTWTLLWDGPSQAYKIIFNGSDISPGYGNHSLTIEAWKDGHKAQTDVTQTLNIQEEPTTLVIQWSNSNDITYVDSTTLIANYTMSDGSPVIAATINVTIGTDIWQMMWVEVTQTYQHVFDGDAVLPGLGFHDVTVEAGKFGYVYRSNSTLTLTISEEPTTLFVTWSYNSTITYIEETYLIVHYNMSDGSAIVGATVNVTINSNLFNLTWHPLSQTYRLLINGSDDPPGLGTWSISILADLYGFESRENNSETLKLREDPTTLLLSWSDGNSISYIEQTTLSASYTMSNGSAIPGALVNVTIGGTLWNLTWHQASGTYRIQFNGTDVPPGFDTHSLTVKAGSFGFEGQSDSTEELTISEETTTIFRTWSYDFNITYIEETYLIVHYNRSDGSPIPDAIVNVTINSNLFNLTWHPLSQTYRLLINGSDNPPGLGTWSITVRADLFGYEAKVDSTGTLVLREDPTTLHLSWSDGNSITYIGQTTLIASFTMSNGSAIRGALVNATDGFDNWALDWHEASDTYRVTFLGTDVPPGFGIHNLTVKADLFGFAGRTDTDEQLTISEEPTTLTINWSNGFSITYVTQTTLSVSYRMSNTTPISDANVTVTIGVDVWNLTWNLMSEEYEVTFRGDDIPPGIGDHNFTIDAAKMGFVSQSDDTRTLTISIETTSLQLEWWLSDTVTYVGQTVLYANFTMSNGSAVVGAFVTVAIGTTNKTFEWNEISEVYHLILTGSDPGYLLGAHTVTVQATLFGYEQGNDNTQTLTVLKETTTVTPSWNPDNNITFFESTTLSVRYDMNNGTAIPEAIVNVTIGTGFWNLTWNPVSEAYECTITGSDNPPGYGTHSVEVKASKYGYVSIIDSTQQITIRLEDTVISFEWDPSNTITYVGETKIRIFYQMANGTPVEGATVNITGGGGGFWDAVWNDTSQAYEYSWLGADEPPGLNPYPLEIKAWKADFEGIADISQTLTINEEPTQIFVSWSNGNNITYVQSTILLVNYTTSGGVVIPNDLVDVTIGTDNWILDWNATSQLYEKTFSGSDTPPGLGTNSLSIRGSHFGYETTVDASETLTFREEPTTLTPSWSPGNTITYVGSTTLSVRYEMSSGDPISGATVNVTIGTDVWVLVWNPISEAYEYTFTGSDDPPGLGVHSLTIQAYNWGYQYVNDSLESLTITEEPTSFVISWSNTDNITYINETTLSVRYQMINTTAIAGALLNVTINGNLWPLTWNADNEAYEVTIRGDDDPPGYGNHSVEIRASKFGFVSIINTTEEFTIRLVDTIVSFVWVSNSTITYTGQTTIRISYNWSSTAPVIGATVNVTIGSDTWTAIWSVSSEAYEYTWFGNDDPPGLGFHSLTVQAWKVNYVAILDTSQTLTIVEEPTRIQAYWTDGKAITFVQSTTLQVNYTASDNSTILGASVYVTIGTDNWNLTWNPGSLLYEIKFNGSDVPPGLGSYGLAITGDKFGYETTVNITMTLTISGELGSISSELLEGSTISFIGYTTLAVNYTMSNGTAIPLATVNVTISGILWNLTWHPASETYRIQFNGTDSPPGFGTHTLIVQAWRDGFDYVQATQFLTIEEEETSLVIYWGAPNFNNITYFDYTYLFAEYKMSNDTAIQGANVNVTIDSTTWTLEWNSTQGAYSLRFNGSDSPPGLGTHDLDFK